MARGPAIDDNNGAKNDMGKANRSGSRPGVTMFVLGTFLLAEFTVLPTLALAFPGLGGYPRWAASSAAEG